MPHAVVDGRDTFDVIFNGEESPAEWGMAKARGEGMPKDKAQSA